MSTWTTPAAGTTGAVAVAFWNTEVRDHFNFIKGALDLLTSSSTADTGNTMYLEVIRAGAAAQAFRARVLADTVPRFEITASGELDWSSGAAAVDTRLFRGGVANITTPDQIQFTNAEGVVINISNGGVIQFDERSTDPVASAANTVRLYARDNGAGKTQLCVRFETGAVGVLFTQP